MNSEYEDDYDDDSSEDEQPRALALAADSNGHSLSGKQPQEGAQVDDGLRHHITTRSPSHRRPTEQPQRHDDEPLPSINHGGTSSSPSHQHLDLPAATPSPQPPSEGGRCRQEVAVELVKTILNSDQKHDEMTKDEHNQSLAADESENRGPLPELREDADDHGYAEESESHPVKPEKEEGSSRPPHVRFDIAQSTGDDASGNDQSVKKADKSGEEEQEEDAATTTAASSEKAASHATYDLQVGAMREMWPKDLTSIVCVDTKLIVRYSKALRKLDLVAIHPDPNSSSISATPLAKQQQTAAAAASQFSTVKDSYWLVEMPRIVSIHHFSARLGGTGAGQTSCIFCLMEDLKRYLIFKIEGGVKFEQITAASLPIPSNNSVVFIYRELPYLLAYQRATGDYIVSSLLALSLSKVGTSTVVARGTFRAGWTDVVWKGTHHVRCTRQKFFCYNSDTGDTIFECVWVRGGSATSSVCSQEHVQLPATGSRQKRTSSLNETEEHTSEYPNSLRSAPLTAEEDELQTVLRRKSCFVVPITIAGKTSCLLYSHSDFSKKKVSRDRSTSKVLSSFADSGQTTASAANLIECTSLMLTKKVFAHPDPWTHFCMIEDVSLASPARLLCYSSISGIVWVNTIFACKQPEKVVTIVEQPQISVSGILNTDHASAGRSARQAAAAAGLTTHALRGVDHTNPVDVKAYTQEQSKHVPSLMHPPSTTPQRSPAVQPVSPHQDGHHHAHPRPPHHHNQGALVTSPVRAQPSHHHSAGAQDPPPGHDNTSRPTTGGNRMRTRPASSSDPLHTRLSMLPPATGDLPQDLKNVIQHLKETDFFGDPACTRLALEDLEVRSQGGASSALMIQQSRSGSGSPRIPWRPVIGYDHIIPPPPSSWPLKFEKEYKEHLCKVTEAVKSKPLELRPQLYQPVSYDKLREEFLERMDKEAHINTIGKNADPKSVAKTIEKLSTTDVELRKKHLEAFQAEKEKEFVEFLAMSHTMDESKLCHQVDRLYEEAITSHEFSMEKLKQKYSAKIPNSPPLGLIHNSTAHRSGSGTSNKKKRVNSPFGGCLSLDDEIAASPELLSPHRPLTAKDQAELGKRLGKESVALREKHLAKIRHEMDANLPVSPKLPTERLISTGARLYRNEKRT